MTYLLIQDYATPETKKLGEEVIDREEKGMSTNARRAFMRKQALVVEGQRDLNF